jgi:hypothetical protein
MNTVQEKQQWSNGHDCFGFVMQCITECIEQKQIRFTDPMIATLSVWAMAHGLVSLDLRCRFKVMDMDEEAIQAAIEKSSRDYLELIKN